MNRVETGIPGFDAVAQGGIPDGRTTLVAGTSGAGKTVFGLQFLATGAARGERGVLVTFEESPENLLANHNSFPWGLSGSVADGTIAVVDATLGPEDHSFEVGDFDLGGLTARIRHAIKKTGATRVYIDSADSLFVRFRHPDRIRVQLGFVLAQLRPLDVTTLISMERTEEYGPVARHGQEEFVADNVVILRNTLEGERRRRTAEILKFRGAEHRKGEYPLVIDGRSGIEIFPVSAIDSTESASEERVSLGSAGLDAMCGKGVFRDSVVLLTGPTGSGKSLLTTQFAADGAASNEPSIIFSFEENADQIVRNARSWGTDLASPLRAGMLRIVSAYPERMGLEDLLVEIKRQIHDFGARRVVIDSLTAIEHTVTRKSFREFTAGLASLFKTAGVTAVMTSGSETLFGGTSATGVDLSTMTDGILVLRYVELDGEIRRGIMVLKLRGAAHDRAIHEYEITDHGMRILDPIGGIANVMAGNARYLSGEERKDAAHDLDVLIRSSG